MEYEVLATNLPSDPFVRAYLEAAEWAGLQDEDRKALEDASDPRWDAVSIGRAFEDCDDFRQANAADLEGIDEAQAGHDFYLTRNGHGTGFWDRGLGEVGERLSRASKVYGSTFETFDAGSERLVSQ